MTDLKKVTGIVRTECVPRALDRTEVTRFYLSRVHAVGLGGGPRGLPGPSGGRKRVHAESRSWIEVVVLSREPRPA